MFLSLQDFVFADTDDLLALPGDTNDLRALPVRDGGTLVDDEDAGYQAAEAGSGPEDEIPEGSGGEPPTFTTLPPREPPVFPPGQGGDYPGRRCRFASHLSGPLEFCRNHRLHDFF